MNIEENETYERTCKYLDGISDTIAKYGFKTKNVNDFYHEEYYLTVIVTIAKYNDGKWWIHVSYAHLDKIPRYEIGILVKKVFIGDDRRSISVLPSIDEHINLHSNCLHMFSILDSNEDCLPDFRIKLSDRTYTI